MNSYVKGALICLATVTLLEVLKRNGFDPVGMVATPLTFTN